MSTIPAISSPKYPTIQQKSVDATFVKLQNNADSWGQKVIERVKRCFQSLLSILQKIFCCNGAKKEFVSSSLEKPIANPIKFPLQVEKRVLPTSIKAEPRTSLPSYSPPKKHPSKKAIVETKISALAEKQDSLAAETTPFAKKPPLPKLPSHPITQSKTKAATPVTNTISEVQPPISQKELGSAKGRDRLSKLPRALLAETLSFLDRKSLRNLSCVSKGLNNTYMKYEADNEVLDLDLHEKAFQQFVKDVEKSKMAKDSQKLVWKIKQLRIVGDNIQSHLPMLKKLMAEGRFPKLYFLRLSFTVRGDTKELFKNCPNLKALTQSFALTSEEMASLPEFCPEIERLIMCDDILPKALGDFISRSPNLNILALTFEHAEISVEKLNQIFHSRPALKVLFLQDYTQITDLVLDRLSYLLPKLSRLYLQDCKGFTPLQLAQSLKKFSALDCFELKAEDSFCKEFVTLCKDLLPDFTITVVNNDNYSLRLVKMRNGRS